MNKSGREGVPPSHGFAGSENNIMFSFCWSASCINFIGGNQLEFRWKSLGNHMEIILKLDGNQFSVWQSFFLCGNHLGISFLRGNHFYGLCQNEEEP